MKKEVSSTTASTEAIIFGVAVSDFHGSLSWMLTTCTLADLPPLSVAWAKVCAASLACCTGSVMRLILGVSRRSSRGEIGRAHVCTPVTNAHLVCRLLHEKKNKTPYK